MTHYSFREMPLDESRLMIRYFLGADNSFLNGMGVDPTKLPSEDDWFELLREDYDRPLRQRHFYYLTWVVDGDPIGHCNINKIAFGEVAYIHLHIWNAAHRRSGCSPQLFEPSITHFFERFELTRLFCEPYTRNLAPNKALPKAGFRLVKTYDTTPGWITNIATDSGDEITAFNTSEFTSGLEDFYARLRFDGTFWRIDALDCDASGLPGASG